MNRSKALAGTLAAAMASGMLLGADHAQASRYSMSAALRDPAGAYTGFVSFTGAGSSTVVTVVLFRSPHVTPGIFHGLHVHANDDPANGSGCKADDAQPPSTWFVAVDGHLAEAGQHHGAHAGDLPSPIVTTAGRAVLNFTTDRIDRDHLRGRAVVLHAGPDNFGNVPTGPGADQYIANSPSAVEKTHKAGNAGDRVACGVIR